MCEYTTHKRNESEPPPGRYETRQEQVAEVAGGGEGAGRGEMAAAREQEKERMGLGGIQLVGGGGEGE